MKMIFDDDDVFLKNIITEEQIGLLHFNFY